MDLFGFVLKWFMFLVAPSCGVANLLTGFIGIDPFDLSNFMSAKLGCTGFSFPIVATTFLIDSFLAELGDPVMILS